MVLEQIVGIQWIEKKEHAFILGFLYSLIGFISALLIFPDAVGLMTVAFTSLLTIPSLNKLLLLEENAEIREKKFHFRQLFKDHVDIFKVYIYMFLGIFAAHLLIGLLATHTDLFYWFQTHMRAAGVTGSATAWQVIAFKDIVIGNMIVLLISFALSLAYGAGAILFLTWNAAVWGVVFGDRIRESLLVTNGAIDAFWTFLAELAPIFPHMLGEGIAYISAAIVGGVVSKAVLREKLHSKKFNHVLTDAVIFLVIAVVLIFIAGYIEVFWYWEL